MDLEGQKIKHVRPSTREEEKEEYWDSPFTVIELENGSKIYASRDSEGNGPGELFGCDPQGKQVLIMTQ